jgi:hypothetical protein
VTAPVGAGTAVRWLTVQAVAFGVMAALLGVVANAIFLDTYGAEWLPTTYIAIGFAGVVLSGAVARSARSGAIVRIALVVLGGAAGALVIAWLVAVAGGAWVSIPLLVAFPILIQLGFVFIGAQAGRLLDIAGIKASFPRIVAGFPVGAVVGGVLGGWLVGWTGRVEDLLLATAVAQAAFAGGVGLTGRRYVARLGPAAGVSTPAAVDEAGTTPSLRVLLGRRFVILILGYQVLSALASQLADFLVFDRAAARFPEAAELAGFLAGYTVVMNLVSIGFLFVVAGPLLRHFGLRAGIAANPVVLTVFAVAMLVIDGGLGGASLALLAVVSAARIADVALTDGTTRTSINAAYQVLSERLRLAVQAVVEGIGVPVAIGLSGVLIIVLGMMPAPLETTIVVLVVTCLVWSGSAEALGRAYGPALVDALRRRRWLDVEGPSDLAAEAGIDTDLLVATDPRAARLAFDVLGRVSGPTLRSDLHALADDPRADVRMAALAGSAAMGDAEARARLAVEVRATADSDDAGERLRAARALEVLEPADRQATSALLVDADPVVRCAAIEAVRVSDRAAVQQVVAALDDARTFGPAADAIDRLGDAVVPMLAERLDAATVPVPPGLMRLVRSVATPSPARNEVLLRHIGHPDRELGLAVMERLGGPDPIAVEAVAPLHAVLVDDARHAARILAAERALEAHTADPDLEPLRRALGDERDLDRQRVAAGCLARYGSARLGPVLTMLPAGGPTAALAIEAMDVLLTPEDRDLVGPILRPGWTAAERLARLERLPDVAQPGSSAPDLDAWLRDLIEDPAADWRSPWLRACAVHAAAARGMLSSIELEAARALGDPVVDEELAIAGAAA